MSYEIEPATWPADEVDALLDDHEDDGAPADSEPIRPGRFPRRTCYHAALTPDLRCLDCGASLSTRSATSPPRRPARATPGPIVPEPTAPRRRSPSDLPAYMAGAIDALRIVRARSTCGPLNQEIDGMIALYEAAVRA